MPVRSYMDEAKPVRVGEFTLSSGKTMAES